MQIEEKVLEIISEYKKKTEKECYFINYNDEIPNILDDKIGGKPYLPIGEDYPIDKYGNPMALFIQINFKNLDLPNYPMEIENKFNIDYYDLTDKLNDDYVYLSNVGGYPYFSNDPDLDYDVKEECMVFIGSDLDKRICFGADAGRFYVLITKEDLLNKNFEKATCNFEF